MDRAPVFGWAILLYAFSFSFSLISMYNMNPIFKGEVFVIMKRSEQFRQANREAKTTVLATIVVILFWIVAGFGLADSDIVIFDTPIWVIGGCIVSWLFAVVVAWWLAEYVIKDVDMKEDATVKGGGK